MRIAREYQPLVNLHQVIFIFEKIAERIICKTSSENKPGKGIVSNMNRYRIPAAQSVLKVMINIPLSHQPCVGK